MGFGRWSMRKVGGAESHTIEFGFKHRFDVSAGPKSDGRAPDFWRASSRAQVLGDFPTSDAAKQACEAEARRILEAPAEDNVVDLADRVTREQWDAYLASKNRLRSRKVRTRYK